MKNFIPLFQFSNSKLPLKRVLKERIPIKQKELKEVKEKFGDKFVAQYQVNQVIRGMRGIPALFYDQSTVDSKQGVLFRGHTVSQVTKLLPKRTEDQSINLLKQQPLPEGIFFLLLTGVIPTFEQVEQVRQEWDARGGLSNELQRFINSLDKDLHPLTMLSMVIMYEQRESKFASLYGQQKLNKSNYWEYVYEDSVDLIAKLPRIAATIYRRKYNKEIILQNQGMGLDWTEQLTYMMGNQNNEVLNECLRAYLTVHADHEGGEVSTHGSYVVGSALGDPYLSLSTACNGIQGPLHGLASEEALKWILQFIKLHGYDSTETQIQQYVDQHITEGRLIPGFGHSVLRVVDPRFNHFYEFSQKHLKEDKMVKLLHKLTDVIPQQLGKYKQIKNPFPNVDAHTGTLLYQLGIKEYEFYTVLFAISRSLGILTNLVWCRAYGLPIERPESCDMTYFKKLFEQKQ
ncbi:hypothetical protein IMG5_121190 [Ichthyophthirius multifiliis]|uniref:Citrate synthase n=1 Tax=Ichthyophthirius multifiliis TaxID=5932 RepID=G0QV41_ICHMU|nr:hypothetical protein IMG5_121190 [Ichthyophthirius multifiliis]EGR30915.1 hypothetical protein IMG5_121190 [Ichthyophthirius multifiliis]|eukprot:XP_004032502.1 hypothetical protein IMG5_121190 [Ichthyophthirius multifiliis]